MSDKTTGVDFDRQVFVRPEPTSSRPAPQWIGFVLALAAIGAFAFLGYLLLQRFPRGAANASGPELAKIDQRLTVIEGRLDKLERTRRRPEPAKSDNPAPQDKAPAKPAPRNIYKISPTRGQPMYSIPAPSVAMNKTNGQRLSTQQPRRGASLSSQTADEEAWQATTNKLADMAGQVGTQSVAILRSQDELNVLLYAF